MGRSDRFAAYPADEPYPPADVATGVLAAPGVDRSRAIRDAFGRTVPLSAGEVRGTLVGVA